MDKCDLRAGRLKVGVFVLALTWLAGGCPLGNPPQLDGPNPGLHWVQSDGQQLSIYELPAYRGEAGRWIQSVPKSLPEWFSGDALYSLDAAGVWTRESFVEGQTLDDVLQTYDPPPRPEPRPAE